MKTEVKALIGTLRAEKQRIEVAILALSGVLGNDAPEPPSARMMRTVSKRRKYAPELKARIVSEYQAGSESLEAVAKRHGVSQSVAANWVYGKGLGKPNGTQESARELVGA